MKKFDEIIDRYPYCLALPVVSGLTQTEVLLKSIEFYSKLYLNDTDLKVTIEVRHLLSYVQRYTHIYKYAYIKL